MLLTSDGTLPLVGEGVAGGQMMLWVELVTDSFYTDVSLVCNLVQAAAGGDDGAGEEDEDEPPTTTHDWVVLP